MAEQSLTEQQAALIRELSVGTDNCAGDATGGSGKTFVALQAATRTPHRRYLYTAYNRAITDEVKRKAPANLEARTGHSLAFGVGAVYSHRIKTERFFTGQELADALHLRPIRIVTLNGPVDLTGPMLANIVIETVERFCISDTPRIRKNHLGRIDRIDPDGEWGNHAALWARIEPAINYYWIDQISPHGRLPFNQNSYRKLWSLIVTKQCPPEWYPPGAKVARRIAADTIILDEAADTAPVMFAALRALDTRIALLGDRMQAINSWAGSIDVFPLLPMPDRNRLTLSKSFRYGPELAPVVNRVLRRIPGSTMTVEGWEERTTHLGPGTQPTLLLCRTNAGVIGGLLDALTTGRAVHVIGGIDEAKRLCQAARQLIDGEPTTHPVLGLFPSWPSVLEYVTDDPTADPTLKRLTDTIATHGIDKVLKSFNAVVARDKADLTISTVHRSKGLESPHVKLADDFHPLPAPGDDDTDRARTEGMLAYVAVTRAQQSLDLTDCPMFTSATGHLAVPAEKKPDRTRGLSDPF